MGLMTQHVLTYEGQILDIDRQLMEILRAECEESLASFVKQAWHIIEPGQPYIHGWHIDFICEHLEAITRGEVLDDGTPYNRLLINVPPGTMKSLLVGVFWPAWEWGPQNLPHHRFVCASHSLDLAIRDGLRMRRLITSEWYQERWGDRVQLTGDQNQKTKFENTATGFRQAAAAGSITGARGDRVIIDDPHSVDGANSDAMRESTVQWFKEAVPTRLNNPDRSAIVVVMQRLHEADVSGTILDGQLGYDHIMLPMEYDQEREHTTMLGLADPREEEGELLFPERFPPEVVERDKRVMGPYATAGQFQQEPTPRGGGVIKPAWWVLWENEGFPPCDYIVASLDTAYTTKQENDFSALTVWGIFTSDISSITQNNYVSRNERGSRRSIADQNAAFDEGVKIRDLLDVNPESVPRVLLMGAWQERLEMPDLVDKVISTCKLMKVDTLLVENKAAGISVGQELRRLMTGEEFGVTLINPGSIDKLSRLYSVQHLFSEGVIYAPDRHWSDLVIKQCEVFPKGKHDDLVDTVSMALRFMRERNLLVRAPERMAEIDAGRRHVGSRPAPLYPI
jgi:predicted phage terminase large subunit-like protein